MCRLGPVRVVVWGCLLAFVAPPVGRAQQALPVPTPGESKIGQALHEKTEFDFTDQPLADVVDFLKQRHGIEIQLDRRALEDAGLGSDTPITRRLKNVSLRSALRLMLGEYELTYLVRDGYLQITSRTEAENMLSTKVYPVADLVTAKSDFQPPARGPRRPDPYQTLIQTVKTTIAPDTWDDVGGPGTVEAFRNGRSIVVSQTSEAHEDIAELLAVLRKTRDKQRAVAAAIARPRKIADEAVPEMRVRVYRLTNLGAPGGGSGGRRSGGGVAGGGMGGGGGFMDVRVETDAPADDAPAQKPAEQPHAGGQPVAANPLAEAAKPGDPSTGPAKISRPQISAPLVDFKQLDAWASEIARLLPELVEPESWEPRGKGVARAAAGALIVRQTDDIHDEIEHLLGQIVSFHVAPDDGSTNPHAAPLPALAMPGPQVNWPEFEPRPAGAAADIERALDGPAEFELTDQPLSDVVDLLGAQYGIQAQLDQRALEDAGFGSDTPITLHVRDVSPRRALRLMLGEYELTYVIRNEVLLITSKTEAENMLVTRVYPVFDLVVRSGDDGRERSELDYRPLAQLIKTTIAPDTWDDVGGPGTDMSFANAGALVISQTTEVHEEIAEHLRSLRAAAAQGKDN